MGGTYIGFISAALHNNKQLLNGKEPRYYGIGGHLFALAVKESVLNGGDGTVYGYATNTKVLNHYVEVFGAIHFPRVHEYKFFIEGKASENLLNKYTFDRR